MKNSLNVVGMETVQIMKSVNSVDVSLERHVSKMTTVQKIKTALQLDVYLHCVEGPWIAQPVRPARLVIVFPLQKFP